MACTSNYIFVFFIFVQQGNQNLTRKIVVYVDIGQAPVRLEALPLLPNHIGNFAVNTLVSRIGIADLW